MLKNTSENMSIKKQSEPLLKGISQFEVDFVIPRVGIDLPIGIDPFLLFRSRDQELVSLHQKMVRAFNKGIAFIASGDEGSARRIFDFPEVREIGFGYAEDSKDGSGVGSYLSELIIETLKSSPALVKRGVKHIEEMQLVSVGIAQDRTSDMAANFLKEYLIGYTQKQCKQVGIPLISDMPVEHIFDFENLQWYDNYADLPISPTDGKPIILVPRKIVRTLPWINYSDFFKQEFAVYLSAKRVKERLSKKQLPDPNKKEAVEIVRDQIERLDRYVENKEKAAEDALPSNTYLNNISIDKEGASLKERISSISPGRAEAILYQKTVLDVINFLFNPDITDGEMEEKTIDGTERRDIIFLNESSANFWSYVRSEHSSIYIMFEIKNTQSVEMSHLNQTATYLGERLGRLGFIATRNEPDEGQVRKAFSIFNDSNPKKIILFLTDEDFKNMIDIKCRGEDPTRYIQKKYRHFRTSVQ